MDYQEYQKRTGYTAQYYGADDKHSIGGLMYLGLGLSGEAGEVADHIKKMYRKGLSSPRDYEQLAALREELGDVHWYLARLLDTLDFQAEAVWAENLDKLADRKSKGTIKER